jgi:hypothetical protein
VRAITPYLLLRAFSRLPSSAACFGALCEGSIWEGIGPKRKVLTNGFRCATVSAPNPPSLARGAGRDPGGNKRVDKSPKVCYTARLVRNELPGKALEQASAEVGRAALGILCLARAESDAL